MESLNVHGIFEGLQDVTWLYGDTLGSPTTSWPAPKGIELSLSKKIHPVDTPLSLARHAAEVLPGVPPTLE
jgi:hypothetical protein